MLCVKCYFLIILMSFISRNEDKRGIRVNFIMNLEMSCWEADGVPRRALRWSFGWKLKQK